MIKGQIGIVVWNFLRSSCLQNSSINKYIISTFHKRIVFSADISQLNTPTIQYLFANPLQLMAFWSLAPACFGGLLSFSLIVSKWIACSIGLRWGDWLGQSRTLHFLARKKEPKVAIHAQAIKLLRPCLTAEFSLRFLLSITLSFRLILI